MVSLVGWCWLVTVLVTLGMVTAAAAAAAADNNNLDLDTDPPPPADNEEYLLKQVVWKRCYRKLTPACLKLSLVRTVEMMSKDSSLFLLPGVYVSCNSSDPDHLPPELARSLSSDIAPLDDLVAFSLKKYLRSLTLNVNLADFVSGGNHTLQESVFDSVTGRKKENFGYGAIAAMLGGMMATMMMAGLAALAGKALMTSLAALMMAAFAAMRGNGGGGGESKTYEVITKPVVSHINTHSSEVQHEHHGHYRKRSVADEESLGGELGYQGYDGDKGSLVSSEASLKNPQKGSTHKTLDGYQQPFFTSENTNHHHQPKKRSLFSSHVNSVREQRKFRDDDFASHIDAVGHGHSPQAYREFTSYLEHFPLWTLGFFQ